VCAEDNAYSTQTTAQHIELLNKIRSLEQEVQELRGQLEVHAHQLNTLSPSSTNEHPPVEHKELKELIVTTPTPVSAPIPVPTSAPTPAPSSTSDQVSYLAAYELINNKQYKEALPAMQAFVTQYPESGYNANAYYWIGELFLLERNYPEAIHHFEFVLKNYPSSNKSSASLLKIGYALAESGQLTDAKQQLQAVIKNYPDTHAAQLAVAKLETMPPQ
jgi:tol-pal system protein YbgF